MDRVIEQTEDEDEVKPKRVANKTVVQNTEPVESVHTYKKKKIIYKTYQVIWYFLGFIEVLLGFRFILKMLGASITSPFTRFIYDLSYPFAYPFMGIFQTLVVPGGFVLEWWTLIGMLVYVALAYGLIYFIQLVRPASPDEVEEGVREV